jgi:hypothetical protein
LLALNIYYARELGVFKWLKARRKKIVVLLLWSLSVALIAIKSYWLIYLPHPIYLYPPGSQTGVPYMETFSKYTPILDVWDFCLILAISLVVGAILLDLETILYSFLVHAFLFFTFIVTWMSLFIWYDLGYYHYESVDFSYAVQLVVYLAVKNAFRMTFPLAFLLCFLGVFVGAFIRAYIKPSAEPL